MSTVLKLSAGGVVLENMIIYPIQRRAEDIDSPGTLKVLLFLVT